MSKPPLRIFLSHKLESREKARKVAGALAAFGEERVLISYSGNFAPGIDWEAQIQSDLNRCDWLILLYDGPNVNYDWCLFETGFFRARMLRSPKKRLMCLHDPRHDLPNPLRSFKPVPAKPEDLQKLYMEIYSAKPWRIKPDLLPDRREQLDDHIKRIIAEATGGVDLQSVTTISPSFVFHLKTEALPGLENGIIPEDTYVDGDGGWEKIFGKPVNTISWRWGDLTKGLVDSAPWVHLLAVMMSEATRLRSVKYPSLAFRVKCIGSDEQIIFRLILRRIEVTMNESRFLFSASPIVTPFDPSVIAEETTIFHLYNMAWFFRRRFIEKHVRDLDSELSTKPLPVARISQTVAAISSDMKALWADAQVRGLDDQAKVIESFGQNVRASVKKALQEDWPPLNEKLAVCLRKGAEEAERISQILHQMEPINRFFLEVSLAELPKYLPEIADEPEKKWSRPRGHKNKAILKTSHGEKRSGGSRPKKSVR